MVDSYSSCASCALYDLGSTPSSVLNLVAVSVISPWSADPEGRRLCFRWKSHTAVRKYNFVHESNRLSLPSTPMFADGTRYFVCDRVNPLYGLPPCADSVDVRLQFDPSRTDESEGYAKRFLVGTGEGLAVDGFGLLLACCILSISPGSRHDVVILDAQVGEYVAKVSVSPSTIKFGPSGTTSRIHRFLLVSSSCMAVIPNTSPSAAQSYHKR